MLRADYEEVSRTIARRLGYPLSTTDQSAQEKQSIADCIRCGLRWFYFPTGELTHAWSFLRRYLEIPIVAQLVWYELPRDFAGFAGAPALSNSQSPLAITDESGIRLRTNKGQESVAPKYTAVRTAEIRGNTGYHLGIFPAATATDVNAQAVIQVWYVFEPQIISIDNPYAYGSGVHAETIMAACLAAAEQQMNPETMAQEGGVHWQYFQQQLAGSVATDKLLVGV